MRFTVLLIGLLLTLASCHISFFDKIDSALEDQEPNRNKDDIVNFFEGVASHFNLSSPTQIPDCFCDVNAGLYFKMLEQLGQIFEDTKERNSMRLHLEFIKIGLLFHNLKDTHACIFMTQDFTVFLDTLGIKERNPHEFSMDLYFYYQAHYSDLFEGFKPIIDNLNSQSHQAAGEAFGAVIDDLVQTVKKEGLAHIAYQGFANGGSISLDIDDPQDSLQCYDNEAAQNILIFIYKLAEAVANGTLKEGPLNAFKFMQTEGKEILSKIPKEDIECEAKSHDNQVLATKLGIDVMTEEFGELMIKYINNNRFHYYAYSKSLKSTFDNGNLHHAGSVHAQFIKSVAESRD